MDVLRRIWQAIRDCVRQICGSSSDEEKENLTDKEMANYSTDRNTEATNVSQISKISDIEIEDLSEVIAIKHMVTIAIKYMGIPQVTVENLRITKQGESMGYNRDVFALWRNKNQGINQAQVGKITL